MAGAFNYGQASNQNSAYSGLRGTDSQGVAEANTKLAGNLLTQTANNSASNPSLFQGQTGAQLLPGGQYGLGSNADPAVQQMMKYSFGQASGSAGQRGQLSPENLAGVAGSAVTNSLPSLMPYIQQWQMNQFQAPMALNQAAISSAQSPAQFWASTLGSQSQGSGSQFNFGVSGSAPTAPK